MRLVYKGPLLLHCGPLPTGLEALSNELPVVPVLRADPVTQYLHRLDAAQGLPGTKRETQCLNVTHCSS